MKKNILIVAISMIAIVAFSQLITTQLKLTILNNLGKEEEGVRVRLYKTEADYKAEKNQIDEHYTDKKGVVSFKNLEPIPYYINAVKENKNNYGNAEVTDSLKEKQINKVKVIISD